VHNFSFYFGLNLLNGSSHVHTFFNVKLAYHTSCLYSDQTRNGKQYGISFEVIISSQTKLQLQNFLHAFFLNF